MLLECCVDSVESAVIAQQAGCSRVELCSGLVEGGLTPSHGLIKAVLKAVTLPVHVLIRPRGGDFIYSESELQVMLEDIALCGSLGAHGVVFGVLLPDGSVARDATSLLLSRAGGMAVTFHRAIDLTPDPVEALKQLMALGGVTRVLTSGGANSVAEGHETLARMMALAERSNVKIMAGGGVNAETVRDLVRLRLCHEVHGSFRQFSWGSSKFRKRGVCLTGELRPGVELEYGLRRASSGLIARVRANL